MDKKTETNIKTEFLIHDLKIPIAVIDAGAKSLLNRRESYGPLTDKQVKVLKRILRNTLTTQRLVNDALELGRSRAGVVSHREFSVAGLVTGVLIEVFDLLDPGVSEQISSPQECERLNTVLKGSGTQLFFDPKIWKTMVKMDPVKVSQILRNLLTNAFKYRNQRVEIHGTIKSGRLILKVKDDGSGIPQKDHEQVFKSYFTTGALLEDTIESHGLGLAGVMVLLRDMGGEISLESADGQGTEFTVQIPF